MPIDPTIVLSGRPIDPLETVNRVQSLKGIGQEQQMREQEIQQRGMQLQQLGQQMSDQQTIQQTLAKYQGNVDQALPELAGKINPQTYLGLQKSHLETQKTYADMDEKKLAVEKYKHEQLVGLYQTAMAMPDDQYAQSWPMIKQHAQQLSPNLQLPDQPVPKGQLQSFGLGLMTQEQYLKNAEAARADQQLKSTVDKNTAEVKHWGTEDAAHTTQTAAGVMQLNPQTGNFDKRVGALPKTVPSATINLGGAAAGGLSDPAIDQAAALYATTGQMPAMGMGSAAAALRVKVMNRSAQLYGTADLAQNKASFTANSDALKKTVAMRNSVEAFENTAGKNLDLFLQQAANIPDTGSPWLNAPIRALSANAVGSENMAAYKAARQVALTEIAKVVNNPNLSSVLSDSARKEVMELNPDTATFNQIKRVAGVLKQDMSNRHDALMQQEQAIRSGIPLQRPHAPAASGGFDWNEHPVVK